jgi:hypothetical protein
MIAQVGHGTGMADEQINRIADQIRDRLMPGVEKKDAVMDKLRLRQLFAFAGGADKVAGVDELGQNFRRVVAAALQPAGNDLVQVVLEMRDSLDPGIELVPAEHRLERAKDCKRPAAYRFALAWRDAEHVADERNRNGSGEIRDEIDFSTLCCGLQQAIDKRLDPRLQFAQRARRECRGQQLTHARMIRGIVEDEACGVVLVQKAFAEVRAEIELFVRTPGIRIPVNREAIVIAREKVRPVGHAVDGVKLA